MYALVVRDVQVERAVAIDVGEGDGRAALPGRVEAEVAPLGEVALAVVHENRVRPSRREQDQVEIAVAIDVGERGPGRISVAGADAGGCRDVLEPPAAEVAVEGAAAFRAREKHVDEPVAVDIAYRDAGPLAHDPVADAARSR